MKVSKSHSTNFRFGKISIEGLPPNQTILAVSLTIESSSCKASKIKSGEILSLDFKVKPILQLVIKTDAVHEIE
jgi:hypothetical protein